MKFFDVLLKQKLDSVSIYKSKIDAEYFETLFAKQLGGGSGPKYITILGNPLHFTAKKAQTAKSTKVTLSPVQAGSGDPSPTNIRPISGRTGVTIKGCGKNLFDKSATFNQHNGYILNDSGAQVSSVASGYTDPVTEVFPNTTYILTGELTEYNAADTASGFRVYYYTANGEFIGRSANLRSSTAVPFSSFTTPSNCRMLAYQWQFTHNYPQLDTIQLELGSTATAYEPYAESNDVTISFGETVYGGTLDVETGELVVDMAMVDLGTLTWGMTSTSPVLFYAYLTGFVPKGEGICSQYLNAKGTLAYTDKAFTLGFPNYYAGRIVVRDDSYSDATTFKTAMNGVQLVYELATPRTITLTPEQIQILKGQNNIWIEDGGATMELTYDKSNST